MAPKNNKSNKRSSDQDQGHGNNEYHVKRARNNEVFLQKKSLSKQLKYLILGCA